ncbi:class II glutamine amidotransferase [Oleiphilus sp. HI0125]|uniref:class II glutamine amidotransferase n=1 Tax=Oleiphilus sp. HI0125 TaxID=1822266 RepID=UPI0007C2E484|nr:class II glutamine amidotransferase [Oleiphilus sp. HI0125]KZZ59648.1 class II glutamine amidotransferase [Oleiphilus sp. HI0125]
MCELLAMSANVPTDICFSFTGLLQRGGATGPHKDGWGLVFYEANGVREFKDHLPSSESLIARFLQTYPIKSNTVVSHIRQANVGEVSLANTHPFQRELWGKSWTFAHNGQLKEFSQFELTRFRPVGSTDSEHLFCWLMGQLDEHFSCCPSWQEWVPFVHQCCLKIHEAGIANIILSNGDALFTFCSTKLSWITRRAPFGEAKLADTDVTIDFSNETSENDVVSVVATEPLTVDETWTKLEPGSCCVFVEGELVG